MSLAEQVKEAREAKGLTTKQLNDLAKLGYTDVQRIERGDLQPGPIRLARLSEALGVELTRDEKPAPNGTAPDRKSTRLNSSH